MLCGFLTGHVFADWEVFDTAHCMDRLVSPCAAALDVVETGGARSPAFVHPDRYGKVWV